MGRALLFALTLSLTGCALPHPVSPAPETGAGLCTATVAIAPPRYAVQSITRRWLATDIYEYDVSLQVWNGTSFTDLSPPQTVVLPQKEAIVPTRAVFRNLRQGRKYRARLVILGNPGGTAPSTVLNALSTATPPVFDFTVLQDVQDTLSATFQDQLDPVPFSGTATVTLSNAPSAATSYVATLKDAQSGVVSASVTFPAGQRAAFSNLKAGLSYQVTMEAQQDGTPLATATSSPFSWDPAAESLEQTQAIAVAF